MKKILFILAALLLSPAAARAHFQLVLPSADIVETQAEKNIKIDLEFLHPMEQAMMDMAAPKAFGVMMRGSQKEDLLGALKTKKIGGKSAFQAAYAIKKPGDYVFYVEPAPYWEPSEDKYIIHYTKTTVHAYGLQAGWDAEVGLKAEIVPLVRPYGLWAGNLFSGVVKMNGKPVPNAEIEVEYLNEGGKVKPPADPFITQVIKANADGVFYYAMPKAGWWGFAALMEGDQTIKGPDGKQKSVEIGAVIWVKTENM